ncbi:hypothetical protein ACFL1E_06280, partial [Candidatus Omnitrophota bacterium]
LKCLHAAFTSLLYDIDNEMSKEQETQLKDHLRSCKQCRQLEESLQKVAKPFKATERIQPPESVWYAIKEKIEIQQQSQGFLSQALDNLQEFFFARKHVFASATIGAIILIVVFVRLPLMNQRMVNDYLQEQVQFLSHLSGENGADYYETDDTTLGTAIEQYFL